MPEDGAFRPTVTGCRDGSDSGLCFEQSFLSFRPFSCDVISQGSLSRALSLPSLRSSLLVSS